MHAVNAHRAHADLAVRVLEAARAAGLDVDALAPDDLAAVDEFHIRGRHATSELADLVGLATGQRVLDVGCGLGGTARHLAATYGVSVTGIDSSAEYCRVGAMLTQRTGLAHRVALITADARSLPFADESFDVVFTEHTAMSIADKPRLYGELRRVLSTNGRLALYDVLQGPGGRPRFPVPWADRPENSFLVSPAQLRTLLDHNGFEATVWKDLTAHTLTWFREQAKALDEDPPALGTHLLMGSDAREKIINLVRNLAADRIRVVQAVAQAHSLPTSKIGRPHRAEQDPLACRLAAGAAPTASEAHRRRTAQIRPLVADHHLVGLIGHRHDAPITDRAPRGARMARHVSCTGAELLRGATPCFLIRSLTRWSSYSPVGSE